ncbi:MAG TPA: GLPGLI family protein [Flavobacteriaceae bacterium]|nr:GLPGLI family protein [Flavobacteriaceae bacterium]
MKKIITLITILSFTIVQAQKIAEPNLMVEYTFYDNFRHSEHLSTLVMNHNESIYFSKTADDNTSNAELKGNNLFIGGKRLDTYSYTNKSDKKIISYESLNSKPYAISEKIPQLNWDFSHNETKKINDYNCNKATVDFRGRFYIVWYTKEIPSFFGPWKFSGLPGLILEIKDSTNTYQWIASKIKNKNIANIEIPFKDTKEVTLVEFVELKNQHIEQLRAKVRSKFPKGTQFSTSKNSRQGLEKTYEWEDEQ